MHAHLGSRLLLSASVAAIASSSLSVAAVPAATTEAMPAATEAMSAAEAVPAPAEPAHATASEVRVRVRHGLHWATLRLWKAPYRSSLR